MRYHSRKREKVLRITDNRREYSILHRIESRYERECYFCPRNKKRGRCRTCNMTRFIKRNWKKFREHQWKEEKVIIYNKI